MWPCIRSACSKIILAIGAASEPPVFWPSPGIDSTRTAIATEDGPDSGPPNQITHPCVSSGLLEST